jgi:hypothetical protein
MTGMQLIVPLEELSDSSSHSRRLHHRQQPVAAVSDAAATSEDQQRNQSKDVGEQAKGSTDASSGNSVGSRHLHDGDILSNELREQFEAMKAVWRQAKRESSLSDDEEEGGKGNDKDVCETVQHREDLKRKERETAVETALAVDAEIARWQNGIADLEALLAAEEEEDSHIGAREAEPNDVIELPLGRQEIVVVDGPLQGLLHPHLQFPTLPPVVPDDEEGSDS